jgi:hypothetical protein
MRAAQREADLRASRVTVSPPRAGVRATAATVRGPLVAQPPDTARALPVSSGRCSFLHAAGIEERSSRVLSSSMAPYRRARPVRLAAWRRTWRALPCSSSSRSGKGFRCSARPRGADHRERAARDLRRVCLDPRRSLRVLPSKFPTERGELRDVPTPYARRGRGWRRSPRCRFGEGWP